MQEEMLKCPVDVFLKHYLPFAPSQKFLENAYNHVKDKCLKATGQVDNETGDDELTWGEFDGDTPSQIDGREEVVFAKLERIVAALQDLDPDQIPDGRELGFRYKSTPYDRVQSERDGAGFKWDACLRPATINSNDILDTDAAVIAEFRKEAKQEAVRSNRMQLVGCASHVINNDPCRMWMYGIKIEDEQMSIWYFSRSHSVKSVPFDFTRDFKTFVHVFVSLLFATQAEMGFDPTVWRVVEANGTIRYVYQVQGRFFLTQGDAIFCPRVLCISGRRTRVWRVIEIEWITGSPEKTGSWYEITPYYTSGSFGMQVERDYSLTGSHDSQMSIYQTSAAYYQAIIVSVRFSNIMLRRRGGRGSSRWHREKNVWIVAPIFMCILCNFGLVFAMGMLSLSRPEFRQGVAAMVIVGAITDISIASLLCYYVLRKSEGTREMKVTNTLVTQVIRYTIATSALTSLIIMACLVAFLASPGSFGFIALHFSSGRTYANAVLVNLNARLKFREALGSLEPSFAKTVEFAGVSSAIGNRRERLGMNTHEYSSRATTSGSRSVNGNKPFVQVPLNTYPPRYRHSLP
ncbi:hypothetical protein NP233_g913 [Leucocoprinus birnbaumii]|uniref:Fungal-type protein kinase domain-containing protein n=1 Tax=Leucocoprinus birnbaumii TaxID=56174 RepID=A0AAD5W0Z4_9AGAR|nr:hypothetical protein NP233_g913 [Leucocoprinus birnbaumii]